MASLIIDKIRNIPRDAYFISLNIILIPLFYVFEVCYVLPALYKDSLRYYLHVAFGTYLLHNIIGNLVLGARGPGTIKRKLTNPDKNWRFCAVCNCMAPPRSWHCKTCKTCVLKRDHHCNFFGCCVGYFNHRYFFMFVVYLFVAMCYIFYFNIYFMIAVVQWNLKWYDYIKFLFPLFAAAAEMSEESLFVLMLVINVVILCFTGFLIYHHGNVILQGKITPENKEDFLISYDDGWKNNLSSVFGVKWYLCWVSPFLKSDLPGDGTHWNIHVKQN